VCWQRYVIRASGSMVPKVEKTWEDFEAFVDSLELHHSEKLAESGIAFPQYATRFVHSMVLICL
jgi:hypothetical protein